MKVLFDCRWDADLAPPDMDAQTVEDFLSLGSAAERIEAALQRFLVWAYTNGINAKKLLVKDVRILEPIEFDKEQTYRMALRLQVLLLEGWRSPSFVWSDEEQVEIVEGVQ